MRIDSEVTDVLSFVCFDDGLRRDPTTAWTRIALLHVHRRMDKSFVSSKLSASDVVDP